MGERVSRHDERWDLGGKDLEALLREAEAVRGESLWNDAWRRLKRNRASYWSLWFLVAVVVTSLAAPLLPLPSPIALHLQEEPEAPVPPWRAAFDDGWDHRIVAGFTLALEGGEWTDAARAAFEAPLREVVERAADREVHVRWSAEGSEAKLELALPHAAALLELPLADHIADLLTGSVAPDGRLASADGRTAEVEFAGVSARSGYWDLGPLDRGALWLRYQVFGFWQTGPWLGTDSKGRDLMSRIVWGSRTSIGVALMATLCSLVIGVTYGALSGLLGGRVDNAMMRFVDILYSIPFIFVVIFLITIINEYRTELADLGIEYITVFYVVVGAIYWLTMARVVRGQVLSLKNTEFIEAARVVGASTRRILFVHLVPNVLSVVIVYLTLTVPAVMLFEAFLSFLGLGVEPPKVSWGLLAVDSTEAINPMKTYWWLVAGPAAAMGATLLALNILGDGLRDALDPKLRGSE